MRKASSRVSTPIISPSLPITRTRGTRISLFLRFGFSGVLIVAISKVDTLFAHRAVPGSDRDGICTSCARLADVLGVQTRSELGDGHRPQVLPTPRAHGNHAIVL